MTGLLSGRQDRGCDQSSRPNRTNRPGPGRLSRRNLLKLGGTGIAGSLVGCLSSPSFRDAEVIVGPDGQNVFEPNQLTVETGASVTWGFASGGHNISCRPGDSDEVGLPAGAETFATYASHEGAEHTLVPRGDTFEHTFEYQGRYDYVCVPHVSLGMTGTIQVK